MGSDMSGFNHGSADLAAACNCASQATTHGNSQVDSVSNLGVSRFTPSVNGQWDLPVLAAIL